VIVTLIVFGPDRIPEVMRKLGQLSRRLRRLTNEFKTALELDSLDQDIQNWIIKDNTQEPDKTEVRDEQD